MDVLGKHGSVDSFYKHTASLLAAAPRQTVDLLIAQGRRLLLGKLVSPLVAALALSSEDGNREDESVVGAQILRYVLFCVETLDARDAGVHNLLVKLLTTSYADPAQLVVSIHGIIITIPTDVKKSLKLLMDKNHKSQTIFTLGINKLSVFLSSRLTSRPKEEMQTQSAMTLRMHSAFAKKLIVLRLLTQKTNQWLTS